MTTLLRSTLLGVALLSIPATAMATQPSLTKPRYVAIVEKTGAEPCPSPIVPANWDVRPLFRTFSKDLLARNYTSLLPAIFERFCVYTAKNDRSGVLTKNDFTDTRVVRVDADPDVIVPQTKIAGDTGIRHQLASAFQDSLLATDKPAGFGVTLHKPYALNAPKSELPRIAIVDTMDFVEDNQPFGFMATNKRQRHGIAMSQIAADVRCPEDHAGCRRRLFFAQAFTRGNEFDRALGGAGTLAAAIVEATIRWRIDDGPKVGSPGNPGTPLVLNFSLGWDPAVHGDLPPMLTPTDHLVLNNAKDDTVATPIRAVHAALVYASCLDVLAIAAAGNNAGGPWEQQGPLAPAAWERHAAPTRAVCQTLFPIILNGPRSKANGPSPERRALVYAAGGLRPDGNPIPNARPGSTPRRLLPAMYAVAGTGALLTEAWTGTSVAAAALSGLAANLWTYDPALSPHQVMALIDASGSAIPGLDSELLPEQGPALRIYARKAFEKLRSQKKTSLLAAPPNPYGSSAGGISSIAALSAAINEIPPRINRRPQTRALPCSEQTLQSGTRSVTLHRCNFQSTALPKTASPWLRPQPDSPICPICPIKGGKLVLSLNPNVGVSATKLTKLTKLTLDLEASDTIVSVTFKDIEITDDTLLDLDQRVTIRGKTYFLRDFLATNAYKAGVLSYFALDTTTGQEVRMTSAITISP